MICETIFETVSTASEVAVVNLSTSLNAKNRVPDGNSLDSIRLWVAKRRHDCLTDGLGSVL
jgi:hypothetical protein